MLEAAWQGQVVPGDFLGHLDGRPEFVDQRVGHVVPEAVERLQSAGQAALDGVGAELVAHRVPVAAGFRMLEVREQAVEPGTLYVLDERQKPGLQHGIGQGNEARRMRVLQPLVRAQGADVDAPMAAHLCNVVHVELGHLVDARPRGHAQDGAEPAVRVFAGPVGERLGIEQRGQLCGRERFAGRGIGLRLGAIHDGLVRGFGDKGLVGLGVEERGQMVAALFLRAFQQGRVAAFFGLCQHFLGRQATKLGFLAGVGRVDRQRIQKSSHVRRRHVFNRLVIAQGEEQPQGVFRIHDVAHGALARRMSLR